MSLRLFISCDICNHAGVTRTEERRSKRRHSGRRHYDERQYIVANDLGTKKRELDSLIQGLEERARSEHWTITENEMHFCQSCYQKHQKEIDEFKGDIHELNAYILSIQQQ